jgi:hypothetical protein
MGRERLAGLKESNHVDGSLDKDGRADGGRDQRDACGEVKVGA